MSSNTYRNGANAVAVLSSAAFAGGNLFIGVSMGSYWLSLDPSEFYQEFWSQWLRFLFTIMPIFLIMPIGLALSARQDWQDAALRRLWLITLGLYLGVTLITAVVHVPLNLQMGAATYSPEAASTFRWYGLVSTFGVASPGDAAANRSFWLLWHIPRVLITAAIPIVAFKAVTLGIRSK